MFCYGFGLCVGCLVWAHGLSHLMVGYGFGFGFSEFAEDKRLPTFPFETLGWVGVLGFHLSFARFVAYGLVGCCGPTGL